MAQIEFDSEQLEILQERVLALARTVSGVSVTFQGIGQALSDVSAVGAAVAAAGAALEDSGLAPFARAAMEETTRREREQEAFCQQFQARFGFEPPSGMDGYICHRTPAISSIIFEFRLFDGRMIEFPIEDWVLYELQQCGNCYECYCQQRRIQRDLQEQVGEYEYEPRNRSREVTIEYEFRDQIGERPESTEAQKRARDLLLACLSPAQREEFESTWGFFVTAPSGNRYRINPSRQYNVRRLGSNGQTLAQLCAVPKGDVPLLDQMLAQKLWLEADEQGFLVVANVRKGLDLVVDEAEGGIWDTPSRLAQLAGVDRAADSGDYTVSRRLDG